MAFDPTKHLIDIKGREYLEVRWRLVWFREIHPCGAILTELLSDKDPVIVRAVIADGDRTTLGSGLAEYPRGRQFPAVMKCETAAIGRALAHAGFGTQWAGADVEEVGLVDSPVAPTPVAPKPVAMSPNAVCTRLAQITTEVQLESAKTWLAESATPEIQKNVKVRQAYQNARDRVIANLAAEGEDPARQPNDY